MKDRETLDEAIDRVAARMTQASGGDATPVWTAPVRIGWIGWRVAGGVGVLVLVAGLAVMNLSRVDERRDAQPIAASSSLAAWAPLQVPIPAILGGHRFSGANVARSDFGTPEGVPSRTGRAALPLFDPFDVGEAGVELAETLATLDVAPMSVPALRVEESDRFEPLVVPGLVIAAPSDGSSPRE